MCCGGGPKITNDPNVGQAAQRQAAVAERAQAFSEQYYQESVKPLVDDMIKASQQTQTQQQQLFDLQYPLAQQQAEQYTKYGLPAQQQYYEMVSKYSAPEEYERQASEAMGDVTNATQVAQANTNRMLASRGIDPTSGAATSAAYNNSIMSAAAGAAASTRARNAARNMGMQLTAGAAEFSAGRPATNIGAFASGAGNASSAGFGTAAGAIGAANQGASVPMSGYNMSANVYGQQMSTYGQLASAQANADAQSSAGFGQAIGSLGAAAIKTFGPALIASDRRLKTGIVRIGTHASGVGVYEYEYVWGGGRQVGVMADEVESVVPAAVVTGRDGFKSVNYGMLG